MNLLHLEQIIGMKSLSIYLFFLARLNLGINIDRLPVQASLEALCSEREREREACLSGVGTYLPGTVGLGCRLFKRCRSQPPGHCGAGMQAI